MAMHHPVARRSCAIGIAGLFSLATTPVFAAGFALIEQSVSSMGTAYAGAGSISEDASTVFFNPASMARLEGRQLSAGVHVVLPNSEFSGDATYNASHPAFNPPSPLAGFSGVSVGGGNGGDGGENGVVPHFTYVQDLNDRWKFGVTVNVPFGLSTEYDPNWVGRYSAIEAEIRAINLNPTFSFEVDDHVSVGFGFSAMHTSLKLDYAVDFALLELLGAHPIPGGPFYGGGAPGSADGRASLDVDDWGFGLNFGILLEPTDQTRFGFAYRSKVEVDLGGDVVLSEATAGSLTFGSSVEASLPSTLLLSAYHEVNPKTAVMADIIWTQWSGIDALEASLSNPVSSSNGTSTIIPLQFEDTIRVAVGASYKYNNAVTLRAGLAFDETPIKDPQHRPAALPDEDRIWLDFGLGYRLSNDLSFDIGYAHLFIDDPSINSTDSHSSASPVPTGFHILNGKYDADTNIISAQANWKF